MYDGKFLRQLRRQKDLSQAEVALAANVARPLLSEIENQVARPTPAVMDAAGRVRQALLGMTEGKGQ
jgi:transcriptional regulator with XRE-family HTH domain